MNPTLWVFGDESGTMPLRDEDGVFMATTFAILEPNARKVPTNRLQMKGTIESLKMLHARPSASIVRPTPGYGAALKRKIDTLNTLGGLTRLMSGANREFMPEGGHQPRNLVWAEAMQQAVGMAILFCSMKHHLIPGTVTVFLDRKTLKTEMRALIRHQAKSYPETASMALNQTADQLAGNVSLALREFAKALRSAPPPVSICWSDEPGFSDPISGLQLAHALSKYLFADERSAGSNPPFRTHLEAAGFREVVGDITHVLLTPVSDEAVGRWQRDHGLFIDPRQSANPAN